MAKKDKLFAQFTMMNFLQASHNDRTVQEILDHLKDNTDWGEAQLRRNGPGDLGVRNVQNWLKDIRDSDEFREQIVSRKDPDDRRQRRYKSRFQAVGERIMPPEEACTLLLAKKLIDAALPADFYDESLQKLFTEARKTLKTYERRPKHVRWRLSDYLKRIAITQRGQALVDHVVPYDVLGVITRAMLEGKCVEMHYGDSPRIVHPYGLVIKSPKIYFLAIDDHVLRKRHPAKLVPAQFLCARITKAKVSERLNRVPDDFDADKFIENEGLDVGLWDASGAWDRAFTLTLRIFDGKSDNLLQDLREFPLSKKQTIEAEQGTGHHILKAPGMRASHQLAEWIVGRLNRVEVLGPSRFREHIADQIAAAHEIYHVK